jgi:phospholipase/carboxylesterase
MHKKDIKTFGPAVSNATNVLILLHGRGASADDILGLAHYLAVKDFAVLAPQATNYTWYPYSFLAPPTQNEPWLSSALGLLNELVIDVNTAGMRDENIFFGGFSQGACLTLEFVTRNARRWGGVVAFTGGLIGDRIYPENYRGDFKDTRVFVGSSDPDPHIPVARVHESVKILRDMNASVQEKIYANLGHTISENEIMLANQWVFGAGENK